MAKSAARAVRVALDRSRQTTPCNCCDWEEQFLKELEVEGWTLKQIELGQVRSGTWSASVLRAFVEGFPLTDELVENYLKNKGIGRGYPGTVSKARHDLVTRGWVEDSGEKRINRNNRKVTLWQLTTAGRESLGIK
jgi:hypothetical protein